MLSVLKLIADGVPADVFGPPPTFIRVRGGKLHLKPHGAAAGPNTTPVQVPWQDLRADRLCRTCTGRRHTTWEQQRRLEAGYALRDAHADLAAAGRAPAAVAWTARLRHDHAALTEHAHGQAATPALVREVDALAGAPLAEAERHRPSGPTARAWSLGALVGSPLVSLVPPPGLVRELAELYPNSFRTVTGQATVVGALIGALADTLLAGHGEDGVEAAVLAAADTAWRRQGARMPARGRELVSAHVAHYLSELDQAERALAGPDQVVLLTNVAALAPRSAHAGTLQALLAPAPVLHGAGFAVTVLPAAVAAALVAAAGCGVNAQANLRVRTLATAGPDDTPQTLLVAARLLADRAGLDGADALTAARGISAPAA